MGVGGGVASGGGGGWGQVRSCGGCVANMLAALVDGYLRVIVSTSNEKVCVCVGEGWVGSWG